MSKRTSRAVVVSLLLAAGLMAASVACAKRKEGAAGTGPDPELAKLYERLAVTEDKHASFWETRILESGGRVPNESVGLKTRLFGFAWNPAPPDSFNPIFDRFLFAVGTAAAACTSGRLRPRPENTVFTVAWGPGATRVRTAGASCRSRGGRRRAPACAWGTWTLAWMGPIRP